MMSAIKLQKHKPNEGRRQKDGQKLGGRKNEQPAGFYNAQKYASLRSGEECLCGGVDTLAAAYLNVGKGLRNG